ncbi:hypothetical protein DSW25_04215 [Sulfitobacter donghicola DSW-25 = KCTC 12864 = JCM 14565]|uniref:Uncharacterized protein n=1 Tax=Sulfitobacter donghicola DSW-25 = KCTC 12864 = JCM 14565 TaxID=1300350 RepID=A0A073IRC9_9RHOB|nr:hypothetical protein DSW25_04215 [Sulfitobacter donghicola DSW-25 = KCTC 12864 = JCM 14565]
MSIQNAQFVRVFFARFSTTYMNSSQEVALT